MRAPRIALPLLLATLASCASLAPATLRLEPGASLTQDVFLVDSVRYEGSDEAGRRAANRIGETLTEQLAKRGHLASEATVGRRVVIVRALLAGYHSPGLATRVLLGPGLSPAQCVLRVTFVDRDTGRMLGEMVTTQNTGGRLTTTSKCAYAVADAIDAAAGPGAGR